jgi:hypothetical protein
MPDKTDESKVADLRVQAEQARQAGDWERYTALADQADELESTLPFDIRTDNPWRGVANPPPSFRDALATFFDEGVADRIEAMATELEHKADEAGAALLDARDKLNDLIRRDGEGSPRVKIAQREVAKLQTAFDEAKAEHVAGARSAIQTEQHFAAAERAILQERQPKLAEAENALRAARNEADRLARTPTATTEDRLAAQQAALDAEKNYREVEAWAKTRPSHAEKRQRLQAQLDAHETKQAEMAEALRRGMAPEATEADIAALHEAAAARASMSG